MSKRVSSREAGPEGVQPLSEEREPTDLLMNTLQNGEPKQLNQTHSHLYRRQRTRSELQETYSTVFKQDLREVPQEITVDFANQQRALVFNPSILSHSINLKKEGLLKHIRQWNHPKQGRNACRPQTEMGLIADSAERSRPLKRVREDVLSQSFVNVRKRRPLKSLQEDLQNYAGSKGANQLECQCGDEGFLQMKEDQERPLTSFLERIHIGEHVPPAHTIAGFLSKRVGTIPPFGVDFQTR